MLIPISDENAYHGRPVVNYVFIGLNVLVFLLVNLQMGEARTYQALGLIPDDIRLHTLFTSVFIHAGIVHLLGNMLFLWIAGDNVEVSLGRGRYVAFYLGSGVIAGIFHSIMNWGSTTPLVGASGAISGVLGAYLVLFPENRIRFWYWFHLYWFGSFQVRAKFAIGAYFLLQLIYISLVGTASGISYEAHIGGGLVGAGLIYLFLKLGWIHRERPHAWVRLPSSARRKRKERSSAPGATPVQGRRKESTPLVPRIPRRVRARAQQRHSRGLHIRDPDAWTLIQADDATVETRRVGELVAGEVGCPLVDVTTRISTTRGFLCGEVPREKAERLVPKLAEMGVRALAVPLKDLQKLPRAILLRGVKVHGNGLDTRTEWEEFSCLWGEIRLVACGRIRTEKRVRRPLSPSLGSPLTTPLAYPMMPIPMRRTSSGGGLKYDTVRREEIVIDLYHSDPKLRFRFWEGRFGLDGIKASTRADEMRELARRIVERAKGPSLSPGLTALAQGKSLRDYSFTTRGSYETHNQYLFLLERHSPESLGGGRSHWLEL